MTGVGLVALKMFEGFVAGVAFVEGLAGGSGELAAELCVYRTATGTWNIVVFKKAEGIC